MTPVEIEKTRESIVESMLRVYLGDFKTPKDELFADWVSVVNVLRLTFIIGQDIQKTRCDDEHVSREDIEQAIENVEELDGPMPDRLWNKLTYASRPQIEATLRNIVRKTKQEALKNVRKLYNED